MSNPAAISIPSKSGGLRSFAQLSLLVTLVVTTALVIATTWFVSRDLLRKDRELARQAANFLRDQIREHTSDLGAEPLDSKQGRGQVDYVVQRFRREHGAEEINLIDSRGRAFYSTDASRTGRIIASPELLAEVWERGLVSRLIPADSPTDSGHEAGRALFETHVLAGEEVLYGDSKEALVVELYQPADAYLSELERSRRLVLLVASISFAAMFFAQLGLFRRNQRALAQRTRELEFLSASLEERVQTKSRQLVEAQRLADLGRLAASVAHEVNTPLASIAACAEGLQRHDDPELRTRYLEIIKKEAYRAKGITRDLLDVSRPDSESVTDTVRIREMFEEIRSAQGAVQRGVTIEWRIDVTPADLEVATHPGFLRRILVNFVSNSLDAFIHDGAITLFAFEKDGRVVLGCRDTGAGIAPDLLPRIKEAYVTTKAPGRGTGLGLALADLLTHQLGGDLAIESAGVGQGAEARVSLPKRRGAG